MLEEASVWLESQPPQDILRWAVEKFPSRLTLACSFGMQSVVVIDMLHRLGLLGAVEIFYLDTGVLFAETHQTRLKIIDRYGILPVRVTPELSIPEQAEQLGDNLWLRDPALCCRIRKVEPMHRYLLGKSAWLTGMRRGHSKTREQSPVAQWDFVNNLAKINPVITIDEATLWAYIKANDVPYNPLYDQGYPSIGCMPCTSKVAPGADPRSGRWAGTGKTECGIHLDGKVIKSLNSSNL